MFSQDFQRQSTGDKIFDIINHLILFLVLLLVLYPLYFIVIASVSDPNAVSAGKVWLAPKGLNIKGYHAIFENQDIWSGYKNTILYTTIGTMVNLAFTVPAAYGLARKELVGRNIFMGMITFTMFFGGGLIPTFLLVSKLGMNNTMWALIFPNAISVYNLIVTRNYFAYSIPEELHEAAEVDGCSEGKYFFKIAVPLGKPIIGVIVLMYAVAHWNSYFNALIYIRDRHRFPLQVILREILIQQEASSGFGDAASVIEQQKLADMLKYGVIIVSTLPILCVYPFIQKYFTTGLMMGSIKG
ncbi:MAG: carbohydrate ABC transporter permease [Epulopiscium sp.]|nr:carbohydrate ABC transporter permease [Candidatus Epulonipiscium sp.]